MPDQPARRDRHPTAAAGRRSRATVAEAAGAMPEPAAKNDRFTFALGRVYGHNFGETDKDSGGKTENDLVGAEGFDAELGQCRFLLLHALVEHGLAGCRTAPHWPLAAARMFLHVKPQR